MKNVKEVEVDSETQEESGESGSEDLDYNPKNDEVFDDDDDEHILEDVPRLIQAIASVFPSVEHMFCVKHIHENMKSQFKGGVYKDMLWNAARATTVVEFNKEIAHLKYYNSVAYDWLIKIPVEQRSISYFSGRAQSGLLLNNICEVFNRQLNDVGDQPIVTCLEYIKEELMKRIVIVQQMIEKTIGRLTPTMAAMFDAIKKEATDCVVQWIGGSLYQVVVPYEDQCVINLDRKECCRRKWELTRIPCKHVVAAINHMNENERGVGIPEEWVHAAYKIETWAHIYSFKINPCSSRDFWPVVESKTIIIPPIHKPQVDRPKKKRKKSVDELASDL